MLRYRCDAFKHPPKADLHAFLLKEIRQGLIKAKIQFLGKSCIVIKRYSDSIGGVQARMSVPLADNENPPVDTVLMEGYAVTASKKLSQMMGGNIVWPQDITRTEEQKRAAELIMLALGDTARSETFYDITNIVAGAYGQLPNLAVRHAILKFDDKF